MIKLSVIILSYNTKDLLGECLESVTSDLCLVASNTEIIVVDNGSKDGSVEMVKIFPIPNPQSPVTNHQSPVTIRIIENKENLGFAKGNNIGIKQAKGEYIMLLNSDTIVKPKAIEKLVDFLDGNEDVAAVSPLILNQDGTIQKDPCFLRFPTPIFVLVYYNSVLRKIAVSLFPGLLFSVNDFHQPNSIDQLPGAALIIRREIFNKVGGLDERYPHFFEDVDLSFKLKKLGYKLMLFPKAEIIHFGGKSLSSTIKKEGIEKYYYLNFNSLFLFCGKNYSLSKTLLIKFIILFQLLIKGRLGLIKKLYAIKA